MSLPATAEAIDIYDQEQQGEVEVVVRPLVAIAGRAARWYVTEASAMVLGEDDASGEDIYCAFACCGDLGP